MKFSDKKVFVTGASRGIGQSIAKAFREEGAWVIGTCTDNKKKNSGICNEWVIADFSNLEEIDHCADCIHESEPDVLINNAGINKVAPFIEITPNDFLSIHQINVFAPFRLCQAAIPAMKRKKWGRIINVSSIFGKISKEQRASYSASKFALDGLTIALAAEHTTDGIMANCIAPGFFETDLTKRILGEEGMSSLGKTVPAKRLGQANEIAHLVLWLSSEDNTYLTGQNIAIDGGFARV